MAVLMANFALTIPFLVAFAAFPLWMTFKRPETGTDHTGAQSYLRARAARAEPALTKSAHEKAA